MIDVLFLQGAGEGVHAEWDIRLVESLRRELGPAWRVHYPPMPDEANPTVATWRPAIEQALAALGPGAAVVGHSAGGTILLHLLAESGGPPNVAAIALVAAPFFGEGGWQSDELPPSPISPRTSPRICRSSSTTARTTRRSRSRTSSATRRRSRTPKCADSRAATTS